MAMIEEFFINSETSSDSCLSIIPILFPEGTPDVMLCSLAGAALYVLTTGKHEYWKQVIFAIVSFFGGVYSAGVVAEIITALINSLLYKLNHSVSITISHPVGALVGSSVFVTVLLKLLNRYHVE